MAVDFTRLAGDAGSEGVYHPREIFSVLPSNRSRYPYLRDVQAEVLNQWFDRRKHESTLTIKMNTGSGKTVVGLLILKSCLHEGIGPGVYISPTPYLAQQVAVEAENLGIDYTENPHAAAFLRGRAILITTIYRLINGKSVFGVADEGVVIDLGSLVMDDAHACLAAAEEQFRIILKASDSGFTDLFDLFRSELENQSGSGVLELESEDSHKVMLVPYWAWHNNLRKVHTILHKHRRTSALEFSWPLLKNHLALCECVFIGGGAVEITPRCLPIQVIPSFTSAKRRIFMSATVSDDTVLINDFDVDPTALEKPISPSNANDIGDRMILVPQEYNTTFGDNHLKSLLKQLSDKWNVVVIVPSHYRAHYWSDVASRTLTASNLRGCLQKEC